MRATALLLLAACHTYAPKLAVITDGKRLKATRIATPDGLSVPFSIYDTELQMGCAATVLVDKSIVCAPGGPDLSNTFSDAACTVPALVTQGASPPAYGSTTFVPDSCTNNTATSDIYKIGAALAKDTYYQIAGGSCTGTPLVAGEALYAAALVDKSAFVALQKHSVDLSARYSADGWQGSDGSIFFDDFNYQPNGIFYQALIDHSLHDSACDVEPSGDASPRCLPHTQAVQLSSPENFSDNACTQRAFAWNDGCSDPPPPYVLDVSACGFYSQPVSIYAPGQAAGTLYENDGACVGSVNGSGFETGALLAPAAFGAFTVDTSGTSRVRLARWTNSDGISVPAYFFDSQSQQWCTPSAGGDGNVYCLPQETRALVFSDAACTQPLAAGSSAWCPFFPAGDDALVYDFGKTSLQIYNVGAAVDAPGEIYADDSGACVATTFAEQLTFYGVTPGALSDFAMMSESLP